MNTAIDFVADSRRDSAEDQRRRAFEANLTDTLVEGFDQELHPVACRALVRTLGQAHQGAPHMVDARAAFGVSENRCYFVLQFGLAGQPELSEGPLAQRVLALTPADALLEFTAEEKQRLAACIDKAEIRNLHPLDWRPRLGWGGRRVYLNLIAGRDTRDAELRASNERRAPANRRIGAAIIGFAAVAFAGVGIWLIGGVIWSLIALLADPEANGALWALFGG